MIAMLLPHLHKIPCNNNEKSAGNENKNTKISQNWGKISQKGHKLKIPMIAILLPHLHKIPCNDNEKSAGNENKNINIS